GKGRGPSRARAPGSSVGFPHELVRLIPARIAEGPFPAGAAAAPLELDSHRGGERERRWQVEVRPLPADADLRLPGRPGLERHRAQPVGRQLPVLVLEPRRAPRPASPPPVGAAGGGLRAELTAPVAVAAG